MKKLISFIFGLLMLLPLIAAQRPPCPISALFLTSPPSSASDLSVRLSYSSEFESFEVVSPTVEDGSVQFEVSNLLKTDCVGKEFKLTVLECEGNPLCNRRVTFLSAGGFYTFDIREAPLFITTTTVPIVTTTVPTTTTQPCPEFTCEDCREAGWIPEEECPDREGVCLQLFQLVIQVVVTLAVGGGIGVTIYRSKKTGKLFVKVRRHKHPTHKTSNARRLHSIWTTHDVEPHPRGEVNPKYDKDGRYIGE